MYFITWINFCSYSSFITGHLLLFLRWRFSHCIHKLYYYSYYITELYHALALWSFSSVQATKIWSSPSKRELRLPLSLSNHVSRCPTDC
jgi:hypothetical protein